jgi:DNA-binding NarL/FixJ family response regulator
MLLRGIAGMFEGNPGFEIVGTASTADDAVSLVSDLAPDVITVDLSMPGDVFAAISAMVASKPALSVVIFTAYDDVAMARRAVLAGARGFVLKGRPAEDLFEAIDVVQAGGRYVSPDFMPQLEAAMQSQAKRNDLMRGANLSARETEIVEGLMAGKSNKEIARQLDLSEKTIKHYMTNLMGKLGVRNRLEVVLAMQLRR